MKRLCYERSCDNKSHGVNIRSHCHPEWPHCICCRSECSCCNIKCLRKSGYRDCDRIFPPHPGFPENDEIGDIPWCNMCDVLSWGEKNTFLSGYYYGDDYYSAFCDDLYSDGVTIDTTVIVDTPMMRLPDSVITSLSPLIRFFNYGGCQPNEFDCSYGIYEAPRGSKIFKLIPESKITYKKIIIPDYTPSIFNTALTGLNIQARSDYDYVFAFHHTFKVEDTSCEPYFCIEGEYSYRIV